MKVTQVFTVAATTLLLILSAYAGDTTRITFQHAETVSWGNTRETEGYIIDWNVTTAVTVSFPVDLDAYNNGTMDPSSIDQVHFELQTPEGEGVVNITVSGYFNVTAKGLIPVSGYKEFQNTTGIPVTTPLGEWNVSYPVPVPVPVGPVIIIITVTPILYVNASVAAEATVQGPATISKNSLAWTVNGDVEAVAVHSLGEADVGDEIMLTVKNFSYEWNASLTVELRLEEIHLITSPAYWFETPSLAADEEASVSFSINVIPEFSVAALIFSLLAVSTIAVFTKRKLKA